MVLATFSYLHRRDVDEEESSARRVDKGDRIDRVLETAESSSQIPISSHYSRLAHGWVSNIPIDLSTNSKPVCIGDAGRAGNPYPYPSHYF